MVRSGGGHSGLRTQKSALFQEGINGINWFLACCFKKSYFKSYFNNFWMVVVKNRHGLLGPGTLKSAVSWWADVLYADTNQRKLKVTLIIIGWTWSKLWDS